MAGGNVYPPAGRLTPFRAVRAAKSFLGRRWATCIPEPRHILKRKCVKLIARWWSFIIHCVFNSSWGYSYSYSLATKRATRYFGDHTRPPHPRGVWYLAQTISRYLSCFFFQPHTSLIKIHWAEYYAALGTNSLVFFHTAQRIYPFTRLLIPKKKENTVQ